jgi:ribosomal protein S20
MDVLETHIETSSDLFRANRDRMAALVAELRDALHDKTLAEIAKDKGKSVSGLVAALVAAEEKTIDQAVVEGRITKAQATEIKSKLDERMQALVNGELRAPGDGPHPGFWPGSGYPRGPPPVFGGPRA